MIRGNWRGGAGEGGNLGFGLCRSSKMARLGGRLNSKGEEAYEASRI